MERAGGAAGGQGWQGQGQLLPSLPPLIAQMSFKGDAGTTTAPSCPPAWGGHQHRGASPILGLRGCPRGCPQGRWDVPRVRGCTAGYRWGHRSQNRCRALWTWLRGCSAQDVGQGLRSPLGAPLEATTDAVPAEESPGQGSLHGPWGCWTRDLRDMAGDHEDTLKARQGTSAGPRQGQGGPPGTHRGPLGARTEHISSAVKGTGCPEPGLWGWEEERAPWGGTQGTSPGGRRAQGTSGCSWSANPELGEGEGAPWGGCRARPRGWEKGRAPRGCTRSASLPAAGGLGAPGVHLQGRGELRAPRGGGGGSSVPRSPARRPALTWPFLQRSAHMLVPSPPRMRTW